MILIVDDTPENLFSLKSLLQLHRFAVDTAASGEDALRKILRNDYALIILDVQMPGMDGYEVAENITGYSRSKDIPILFLSAVNIDKRFITRGYDSGGVDYITKPFDPELLLLKVKTFYRLSEQQKALNEAHATLEQKVAERTAELVRTNEALEASNAELQQYAYLASHDLQEPLRKIMTFSNIVADRYLADRPDAHPFVERIIASSVRMRNLINDLLEYSKISGTAFFEHTNLDVLLAEALADLELLIREKGATLHLGPLPHADVIPGQITQLFQNLLSNALKFSRSGVAPEVRVTGHYITGPDLEAPVCSSSNWIRIEVADNGIGFHEEYRNKIFMLFQRLHGREEYAGTGLGLAIVKKIVDRHHGLIGARSQEGAGAAFMVVLPTQQLEAGVLTH